MINTKKIKINEKVTRVEGNLIAYDSGLRGLRAYKLTADEGIVTMIAANCSKWKFRMRCDSEYSLCLGRKTTKSWNLQERVYVYDRLEEEGIFSAAQVEKMSGLEIITRGKLYYWDVLRNDQRLLVGKAVEWAATEIENHAIAAREALWLEDEKNSDTDYWEFDDEVFVEDSWDEEEEIDFGENYVETPEERAEKEALFEEEKKKQKKIFELLAQAQELKFELEDSISQKENDFKEVRVDEFELYLPEIFVPFGYNERGEMILSGEESSSDCPELIEVDSSDEAEEALGFGSLRTPKGEVPTYCALIPGAFDTYTVLLEDSKRCGISQEIVRRDFPSDEYVNVNMHGNVAQDFPDYVSLPIMSFVKKPKKDQQFRDFLDSHKKRPLDSKVRIWQKVPPHNGVTVFRVHSTYFKGWKGGYATTHNAGVIIHPPGTPGAWTMKEQDYDGVYCNWPKKTYPLWMKGSVADLENVVTPVRRAKLKPEDPQRLAIYQNKKFPLEGVLKEIQLCIDSGYLTQSNIEDELANLLYDVTFKEEVYEPSDREQTDALEYGKAIEAMVRKKFGPKVPVKNSLKKMVDTQDEYDLLVLLWENRNYSAHSQVSGKQQWHKLNYMAVSLGFLYDYSSSRYKVVPSGVSFTKITEPRLLALANKGLML